MAKLKPVIGGTFGTASKCQLIFDALRATGLRLGASPTIKIQRLVNADLTARRADLTTILIEGDAESHLEFGLSAASMYMRQLDLHFQLQQRYGAYGYAYAHFLFIYAWFSSESNLAHRMISDAIEQFSWQTNLEDRKGQDLAIMCAVLFGPQKWKVFHEPLMVSDPEAILALSAAAITSFSSGQICSMLDEMMLDIPAVVDAQTVRTF